MRAIERIDRFAYCAYCYVEATFNMVAPRFTLSGEVPMRKAMCENHARRYAARFNLPWPSELHEKGNEYTKFPENQESQLHEAKQAHETKLPATDQTAGAEAQAQGQAPSRCRVCGAPAEP